MDLFAFIRHADPKKVRIGVISPGHQYRLVMVITMTILKLMIIMRKAVILLRGQTKEGDDVGQDEGVNVVEDNEIQAIVVGKLKGTKRKRKVVARASGSNLPPKKLKEDHGASSDVDASTAGKYLIRVRVVGILIQFLGLIYRLGTQVRGLISLDSSHPSSTNAVDAEVTSIVRSPIPPPPVMTAAIATIAIDGATSAPVHRSGTELVHRSIFRDFVSHRVAEADVAGPSYPAGVEVCRSMVDHLAPPSVEVRLRSKHNYREKKKFERMRNRQTDLLKEKDVEIANLKTQLSLKEAEAAEAICLRGQYEAMQDEQVKVLSDWVAGLDDELMGMGLHLDEKFYPHFLTTIAGRRWIISRGFKLTIMKCLQSPEYVAAFGTATGLAIDKGMQTGLAMTLTIEGLEGALLKLPPMILSWKECISLRSLPFEHALLHSEGALPEIVYVYLQVPANFFLKCFITKRWKHLKGRKEIPPSNLFLGVARVTSEGCASDPETAMYSTRIILLLCRIGFIRVFPSSSMTVNTYASFMDFSLSSSARTYLVSQMNKSDLNDVHVNESQVIENCLIDSHESDGKDNQVNDRFKKSKGYHAVPHLYIDNYMPPRADLSYDGKDSLEKPKIVRSSAPIIEEWESDSEDENVVEKIEVKKIVNRIFEKIEFGNAKNTTVKNKSKAEKSRKLRQSPRGNKRN
nr:hypothetical protein [Tanacetum cinerariifolium]